MDLKCKVASFWPLGMPASTTQIIERFQQREDATPSQRKQRCGLVRAERVPPPSSSSSLVEAQDLACISTEASVPPEKAGHPPPQTTPPAQPASNGLEDAELRGRPIRRCRELSGFHSLVAEGCRHFEGADYLRLLSYLLNLGERDPSFNAIAKKMISAQINRTDIVNNSIATNQFVHQFDLVVSEVPLCTVMTSGRRPTINDFVSNGLLKSMMTHNGHLSGPFDIALATRPITPCSSLSNYPCTVWGCWRTLLSLPRVPPEQSNCDVFQMSSVLFVIANVDLPEGTLLALPDYSSVTHS